MTLAIDGHATAQNSGANSVSVSLTTTQTNDIIVVASFTENGGQDISSVTATGLSFTQRKQYVTDFGAGSPNAKLEYWYAVASATFSGSIVIDYAGTFDDAAVIAFGVSGADTSTPWDTNGSLPAVNESTSGGEWTVSGISTDSSAAMLLAFGGSSDGSDPFNTSGGGNAVSPYTYVDGIYNHSGTFWSSIAAGYDIISSAASGSSAQFSTSNTYWAGVVDALVQSGNSVLDCAVGSYSVTGTDAAMLPLFIRADAGSYSIIGNAASLIQTGSGGGARRRRVVIIIT